MSEAGPGRHIPEFAVTLFRPGVWWRRALGGPVGRAPGPVRLLARPWQGVPYGQGGCWPHKVKGDR